MKRKKKINTEPTLKRMDSKIEIVWKRLKSFHQSLHKE